MDFSTGHGATEGIHYYGYLPNPASGTFNINFGGSTYPSYVVMTVQGADTTNPIDSTAFSGVATPHTIHTTSGTTTTGNALLLSQFFNQITGTLVSHGAGETETFYTSYSYGFIPYGGSWKAANAVPTLESVTQNINTATWTDLGWIAVRRATPPVGTAFRAKIDEGSFNSYSFSTTTNTWTVYDKRGTRYLYGSDASGRVYDANAGSSANTHRWMLQEVCDTNGNYITYTYNRDNNVLYPYKITYTGNGSADGISTITFATSTRSDVRVSYASGLPQRRPSSFRRSPRPSMALRYASTIFHTAPVTMAIARF